MKKSYTCKTVRVISTHKADCHLGNTKSIRQNKERIYNVRQTMPDIVFDIKMPKSLKVTELS